jgi:AcrR family transcriptional regulator
MTMPSTPVARPPKQPQWSAGMATQEAEGSPQGHRLTAREAATRDRIVLAAADLMYAKGVNATTLDDVRAATGTSKSQLYRHFPTRMPWSTK